MPFHRRLSHFVMIFVTPYPVLDMSFWRKIVNDYREGFHGVISQPKSPKIANFGKPSENCLQSILKQKYFLGIMNPRDLVSVS